MQGTQEPTAQKRDPAIAVFDINNLSNPVRLAQLIFVGNAHLAGIGIVPATDLAEAAGLEIENGIKTDAEGRTSDPAICSLTSY